MHKFNSVTKSLIIIAVTSFSLNASAQKKSISNVDVKKTSEVINPTENSITYTLPKTVLNIEIETEKVIKKTGPYYRYSQRFLNLNQVITEDSEAWIIKDVKISTEGQSNPSQRYSIFTSGNTSANHINLNRHGILLGINNFTHPTPDNKASKSPFIPSIDEIGFDKIALPQELLLKTSTGAMAEEAANMIYKIRANRIELLSGELENLPPDGEAYKTVLSELNKMEEDFLSLFAGKTVTVTTKQTFQVSPDPLSSYANFVISRFSTQKGLVDAMDIAGTPIYLKIDPIPQTPLENKQTETPKGTVNHGLFYYLPGTANISVVDKNEELVSQSVKLAQYGQVISMPASILEQEEVVINICPVTGALISITKK